MCGAVRQVSGLGAGGRRSPRQDLRRACRAPPLQVRQEAPKAAAAGVLHPGGAVRCGETLKRGEVR